MDKHLLRTPGDVIAALGGSSQAAERLRLRRTRVAMWVGRDRIPSDFYFVIQAELARLGKHASPEVFGMHAPGLALAGDRRRRVGA